MPNIASAKKRLRQSLVRRARNRANKSTLKTVIRKVREAIAAGELAVAETNFRLAAKKLDQAAAKNVIHANAAGRMKSRLSAAIKRAKQAPAA
ncbi:MAG TPA: 30S ribosomal protein S20 [Pirellulales bacterium]|jgi:small subunit ribosomal protein S20|nr:30S ribosomal protein S20 [Pirellulales bacterium]